MKKIIYFIFFMCILYTPVLHSQTDSYLDIGSLRIRFDADSNKVRFGKRPMTGIGTLKLAKEFNTQLFDFNSSHFTWNVSTGLNLNTFMDSISSKQFSLVKDTSFGETQYYKYWNFRRKHYNQVDSLDLLVEYYNSQLSVTSPQVTVRLLNSAYSKQGENFTGLTTTDQVIDTLILPKPGLYQITTVATVNFVNDNGGSYTDSIWVSIDDGSLPGSGRLASSLATHRYNSTVETGGAVTVTATCLFYRQGHDNIIYIMAKNLNSSSFLIHESWRTHTTAVLIN